MLIFVLVLYGYHFGHAMDLPFLSPHALIPEESAETVGDALHATG